MDTPTKARKHEPQKRQKRSSWCLRVFVAAVAMALTVNVRAETGYDLWLRYVLLDDTPEHDAYRQSATAIVVESRSPTGEAIVSELQRGLHGLLGVDVARGERPPAYGGVMYGT